MDKTVLVIGSNSELARRTIEELKFKNFIIFATSRRAELIDEKVREYKLDVTNELDFLHLKEVFNNIKFDTIINFTGIAIASAVDELKENELKKQLDVNLFGLLRILKYFSPNLNPEGKIINISSMASYGFFPYLSPYCLSKASCDILLNVFSIEKNIKTVSIRPGAVATKFWESSIELNKQTFESTKYTKEKEFLIKNAQKNSLKALNPIYASKKIAHIVELKNPKTVYNIGMDSKIAKCSRYLPQGLINAFVRFILNKRIERK